MEGIQLFSHKTKKQKIEILTAPTESIIKEDTENIHMTASNEKQVTKFSDLGLDKWILDILDSLSLKLPTEIQSKCIPAIQQNRDIVASSKTGSGKTAAFAIPILSALSKDPFGVFAIVLTPTRELAMQIAEQFKVFGKNIHLKLSLVVGGLDMMKQVIEIGQRPHIIVATPGRLADIIESCSDCICFSKIKYLVLDEADRILEKSFRPDILKILTVLNPKRQNLLFSATMSRNLKDLDFLSVKEPFVCHINEEFGTVEKISQKFLLIPARMREVYLAYLLMNDVKDKSVIIFTGKCQTAETLRVMLRKLEIRNTALHSQMHQNDRIGSLAKFKSNVVPILISTDVGSRGLDIPEVQFVINFDIPNDAKDYVHRIGRTARAGLGGSAISFVTEHDVELIKNIESKIKKNLEELTVNEKEVLKILNKVTEARREAGMDLIDREFGKRKQINKLKNENKK